jgi:two-component system, OmpR family, sensor kinase
VIAEAALLIVLIGVLAGTVGYFVRQETAVERRRPRPSSDEAGLRALIAEASHELRTPAAVIHSYAELAEQSTPTLPPPVDRALQRIESESARMGRMVEDLLVLSRFEGGYQPQLAEVDLTKLVFDAVDDARVTDRQDRWELVTPDEPVEVLGNGRWLFQAITALLANARAHTPPGTTVRLVLRRLTGVAELSVADNGPGIPPEILPTVFERFVRSGDEARYDGMAGVGLGLSVVRQIVQAHSGTITVDSSPAGTEFVLRLPLTG